MARRKIQNKKTISKNAHPKKTGLRHGISLVILIALLCVASLLFLFVLNQNQIQKTFGQTTFYPNTQQEIGNPVLGNASKTGLLKDDSLDFTLKIPPQMGEWIYLTGYVKSPTDDALSNQYVKVHFVKKGTGKSNNFEGQYQEILAIRKFSKGEWDELEKGCQKGNQFYCEAAGTKIGENNGTVYAYTKTSGCPKSVEAKCALAEKIVKSFKLK